MREMTKERAYFFIVLSIILPAALVIELVKSVFPKSSKEIGFE